VAQAEGGDGLEVSWYASVWCNPPYSRGQVIRWARKAIQEAVCGSEVLMLTPADVSTAWFRELRENCDAVCLLRRRVGFLRPDGTAMPGAKFGSAVWYFGPRRRRFDRIWGEHGHVDHGLGPLEVEEAAHGHTVGDDCDHLTWMGVVRDLRELLRESKGGEDG